MQIRSPYLTTCSCDVSSNSKCSFAITSVFPPLRFCSKLWRIFFWHPIKMFDMNDCTLVWQLHIWLLTDTFRWLLTLMLLIQFTVCIQPNPACKITNNDKSIRSWVFLISWNEILSQQYSVVVCCLIARQSDTHNYFWLIRNYHSHSHSHSLLSVLDSAVVVAVVVVVVTEAIKAVLVVAVGVEVVVGWGSKLNFRFHLTLCQLFRWWQARALSFPHSLLLFEDSRGFQNRKQWGG